MFNNIYGKSKKLKDLNLDAIRYVNDRKVTNF